MDAGEAGEVVGEPVSLQEQDYDSFVGSGTPAESEQVIDLQDAQYDTVKKSEDPDNYETKDAPGTGDGD